MIKSKSYYSENDCNTICDRTGFKVKLSETVRSWDGYQVLKEVDDIRNPQDFSPTTLKTVVYKRARSEQFYSTDTITAPDPI